MKSFDIKDVISITNAEDAMLYVGTKGYTAVCLYDDINKWEECTLVGVNGNRVIEYCFTVSHELTGDFYRGLFLPADKVKNERKYRPYKDTDEFCEHHELGDIITYRNINNTQVVVNEMFIGYSNDYINLGGIGLNLETLFEVYEFKNADGEFVPFGVEE